MMRRRIKRSSLFTLIAVVALLSLGIGYAAWQDTITVHGTVHTGTLSLRWNNPQTLDSDGGALGGGVCNAALENGGEKVNVTVTNAYPGYDCTVTANVTNNGSVPATFTGLDNVDNGEVELSISNESCPATTIAPGASISCSAKVTVTESANQNSVYDAGATLKFASTNP